MTNVESKKEEGKKDVNFKNQKSSFNIHHSIDLGESQIIVEINR
jgi:hypothetical protein